MANFGTIEELHPIVAKTEGRMRRVEVVDDMNSFAGYDPTLSQIYRACYIADPHLTAFGLDSMTRRIGRNTRLAQGALLIRGYLDVVGKKNPDTQGAFRPIDALFGKWPFIKRITEDSVERYMTKQGEQ